MSVVSYAEGCSSSAWIPDKVTELLREETFPEAACSRPIELPSYKAAPRYGCQTSHAANPIEDEDDDEYEDDARSDEHS